MGLISMRKEEQNSTVQQLKSNLMGLGLGNYLISGWRSTTRSGRRESQPRRRQGTEPAGPGTGQGKRGRGRHGEAPARLAGGSAPRGMRLKPLLFSENDNKAASRLEENKLN